uniref:PASTA domain-containing protein n=1 Tax=Stomatohabitans albus TaxID=3110766 RepID=UPI00300BFF9D
RKALANIPKADYPSTPHGKLREATSGQIEVPMVTGRDVEEAKRELEALGLKVTVNAIDSNEKADTVLLQSPRAGDVVDPGATVVLTVSNGTKIKVVKPDVSSSASARPSASASASSSASAKPSEPSKTPTVAPQPTAPPQPSTPPQPTTKPSAKPSPPKPTAKPSAKPPAPAPQPSTRPTATNKPNPQPSAALPTAAPPEGPIDAAN